MNICSIMIVRVCPDSLSRFFICK